MRENMVEKDSDAPSTESREGSTQPMTSERLIQLVIERAEQACRYVLKHQEFEGDGPYRDGFEVACEVCERAIAEHVRRHIEADLNAALAEPAGNLKDEL